MSSIRENLKIWFSTPTETDAHAEALAEAVRRAMERKARTAHRNAQSHNHDQVTPSELQRDTKATCSISVKKYTWCYSIWYTARAMAVTAADA